MKWNLTVYSGSQGPHLLSVIFVVFIVMQEKAKLSIHSIYILAILEGKFKK